MDHTSLVILGSEENNENVGGVRGSKHLTGNAIDINMLNTGNKVTNGYKKMVLSMVSYTMDTNQILLTLILIQLK